MMALRFSAFRSSLSRLRLLNGIDIHSYHDHHYHSYHNTSIILPSITQSSLTSRHQTQHQSVRYLRGRVRYDETLSGSNSASTGGEGRESSEDHYEDEMQFNDNRDRLKEQYGKYYKKAQQPRDEKRRVMIDDEDDDQETSQLSSRRSYQERQSFKAKNNLSDYNYDFDDGGHSGGNRRAEAQNYQRSGQNVPPSKRFSKFNENKSARDSDFDFEEEVEADGDEVGSGMSRGGNYNRGNREYGQNKGQWNGYNNQNDRFEQRNNYNNRFDREGNNRFNNNYNNRYERFNDNNNSFGNNKFNNRYDNNFNRRDNYNNNGRFDNNRFDRQDNKPFNNRYNNRNNNDLNSNYRKNDYNQFQSSDDGRPRFSRIRENESFEKRKQIRNDGFGKEDIYGTQRLGQQENLSGEEVDEDGVEVIDKKGRILEPLPYNINEYNRFEVLNQIVCPLHLTRYEEQLKLKYRRNMGVLNNFGRKLAMVKSPVVRDRKGLPCPIELVKPSPIIEQYRNKDEFSVWPGYDGKSKTVGFFVGEPSKHQTVVCVEPDRIPITKDSHKILARKFQTYLQEVSPYDYCQNFGDGGNWRRFHVRSNDAGQHMVTAIMHPQELTQEQLNDEMQRLKEYFQDDPLVTSLYFQAAMHTRCTNEQAPLQHISGETHILESLMDCQFLISPDSFFQVNKSGAEVLYRSIISEINPTKSTTVLDICCGTGTLACLISPHVNRVIGIDSNSSAINDANKNASLNGIKNTTFLAGKVEEKFPKLLTDLYAQHLVVVANPTRAGLMPGVIDALRQLDFINKFVYVSCKPDGDALKNFVHLCLPPTRANPDIGDPFVPVNAVPVDLFPHTNHCELIISFERFSM